MNDVENIEPVYDIQDIIENVQRRGLTTSDIKLILTRMFDRNNIDMTTRVRDVELDNICNMLHHGHQLTLMMQDDTGFTKLFELEAYVLQNLSLRLSLDSRSRDEIVAIFTQMVKEESAAKKIEEMKNVSTDLQSSQ